MLNIANKIKSVSHFNLSEADSELMLAEDNIDFINYKNDIISSNGKDFINKKRKSLPKIYKNIIEKNLTKPVDTVYHLLKLDAKCE